MLKCPLLWSTENVNQTYITNVWPIWNMRQFVPGQMILPLQGRIANVANKTTFNCMRDDMLFNHTPIRIGHLTFRATEQWRTVQRFRLTYLAWFGTRFLLFGRLFLLLLASAGGGGWRRRSDIRTGIVTVLRFQIMMLVHIGVALHGRIAIDAAQCQIEIAADAILQAQQIALQVEPATAIHSTQIVTIHRRSHRRLFLNGFGIFEKVLNRYWQGGGQQMR